MCTCKVGVLDEGRRRFVSRRVHGTVKITLKGDRIEKGKVGVTKIWKREQAGERNRCIKKGGISS